jgi:hypothetical protein
MSNPFSKVANLAGIKPEPATDQCILGVMLAVCAAAYDADTLNASGLGPRVGQLNNAVDEVLYRLSAYLGTVGYADIKNEISICRGKC